MDIRAKIIKIFAIVLVGVILISGLWIWKEQPSEPLEKTFPHGGIIIASQNGLVNLVYNPSNQTYEKQAEIILPNITGIVRYDNYIFVSTKNEVLRFNSKLKKSASQNVGEVGAMRADNRSIFVAANGSFIVLDKNLKELSKVELKLRLYGQKKNAHDILIYENTAYLLDNIVMPLFLFRVNIEDRKNIRITEQIHFAEIGAHLPGQWLNPTLNQWLVLLLWGHRGGGGKDVLVYPMDRGSELLFRQRIRTVGWWELGHYEIVHDKGIVQIERVMGAYIGDKRINITLVKPQEVALTIKIFPKGSDAIYTENITLDEDRPSYLVTGYSEKHPHIPISTIEIHSDEGLIHKGNFYKEKGFIVRSITNLPPIWAIIEEGGRYYLAQVESKDDEVLFSKLLELDDIATYRKIIIKQKNEYLFVASDAHFTKNQIPVFKIINTTEPTKIIHSEDLRKFGIETIIDILPY